MASPVEKYELILAADPRSRIFVELGRALLERGDFARAAEVLQAGLAHHPDSVQAQLLLGRALLALGRPDEAARHLVRASAAAPADGAVRLALDDARAAGAPGSTPERPAITPSLFPPPIVEAASPPDPALPREAPADAPPAPGADAPRHTPLPPPLHRPAQSPPSRRAPASPLAHLPGEAGAASPGPPPAAALPPDPGEAARIAATYERELREKMLAKEAPAPGRRLLPAFLFGGLLLLVVGSALVFWFVRRAHRADEARTAVAAARAGLARDTLGSLREAARALEEARGLDPAQAEAVSLSAQVNALLWTDFADDKALERARALAAAPVAGEGTLVALYLTAPGAAEREAAAGALLQASSGSGPLLRVLAAGVLRGRGDREGARHHLEAAARSTPPMLRALADLGDLIRAEEPEAALRVYRIALQAHPTHPRAVLGSAEARLALSRNLNEALSELEAMERDPQSAPPGSERLRAELVRARLLQALGRPDEAASSLEASAGRFPGRPEIPAASAELEMARGGWDRALAAAERAVRIVPADAGMKELLARARLGRGRYRELLRDTERAPTRALRILRAQARAELGEWDQARGELEQTRRDGRMPADAAAWMALAQAISGRRPQAAEILQSLGPARGQLPVAQVAEARLLAADGKAAQAEELLRAAAARDGAPPQAALDLARLLRARHHGAEAVAVLEAAAARVPFHGGVRLGLAAAHLEVGNARAATADAERVLEDRPRDLEALRFLSAARLASGDAAGARRAAEKAVAAAPRDPTAWIAAGRAAAAQGNGALARKDLTRALKLAGKGPHAGEARAELAKVGRR